MEPLATFCNLEKYPTDYTDRPTVKAVVINENDEVLLFSGKLPGGGVDTGEKNEEALARECMEEIGATVEIIRELGVVIAYRNELKLRYVFYCYECNLVSLGTPTTLDEQEKGRPALWEKRSDAIVRLISEIDNIKSKGHGNTDCDEYYARIYMREVALIFLKQIDLK